MAETYRSVSQEFERSEYPYYISECIRNARQPLTKQEYFKHFCDILTSDGVITTQIAIEWIRRYSKLGGL